MTSTTPQNAPFGSILTDVMAITWYRKGQWETSELKAVGPIEMHPAAHVLHYGSECFEGFKAYKWADGSVHLFRMDRHIERLRQSARSLLLPEPDANQVAEMVRAVVDRSRSAVPDAPGALYLRPLLFGTMPNIGAATTPTDEACLVVLASPVWDYFSGGGRPLSVYLEEHATRCASHLGMVKTGGNYAAALGPTLAARRDKNADQVLFCPGGEVQEAGAANFLAIKEGHILTRGLDSTFLHGVTRDSLLRMAPELGYRVEERNFTVDELIEWVKTGEAALSGTAAVLSGVGTLLRGDKRYQVGDGEIGANTKRLRTALTSIQHGTAPDRHGWLTRV